jgi:hypothetical protein
LDVSRGNQEKQRRDEQQECLEPDAHDETLLSEQDRQEYRGVYVASREWHSSLETSIAVPASSLVAFENPFQDHSLIALLIPRAVYQGDGVFFGLLFQ